MPLDDNTQQFLAQIKNMGAQPFHQLSPQEGRDFMAGLRPIIGAGPEMYETLDREITTNDGNFIVRLLIPSSKPEGTIIYYHGGGWVLMSIDDYDTLGRLIANESNCTVVLVDYRLAPEHPYPTPGDDSLAAFNWVINHLELTKMPEYGKIFVAGDSAGGNLAATTVNRLSPEKRKKIDGQILIYPVTQSNTDLPQYNDPALQYLISKPDMEYFWRLYCPNNNDRLQSSTSPLLCKNLKNIPYTVIITAENDIIKYEGEQYAKLLKKSGNKVDYRCFDGQIHGFFTLINLLPESVESRRFIIEKIRSVL